MKTRRVDVSITEPDGTVIFEKEQVEVPEGWSDRAATIAASKYFSHDEDSVLTLVGRIVRQIKLWGQEQGYFDREEEALKFAARLEGILLNQRAAFNSPVWFNCGADTGSNQMSACFVLPVEDTMDSILQHTVTAGNIFKGGSGVGINISKLRSKGEVLSGKGSASGPISFMRGWDAFAGVIKSGGKMRRAAVLICMDADHPDIMGFIECKSHEEDKAKMLIAAGIPEKEAYATVDFQNANHSVRVTDSFMEAVENDDEWTLHNRGGMKWKGQGSIKDSRKAKEIFRKIAETAWKCGDPGLQFHDRTNLDNPVPSLGTIRSTNPCAEFCSVEQGACNLASLNLVKYWDPETGGGTFDSALFCDDIRVLVTAMDILIEAADYPTPEVREMTLKTRPLGLGFTNLAALLILMGKPYNSEEGREQATYIAELMTRQAYTYSIMLAEKLGAFPAYKENEETCKEIALRLAGGLPYLRPEKWDEQFPGGFPGFRNSQLTLLAPTGTVSFLMDCDTTGIEPLYALKATKRLAGGGTVDVTPACVETAALSTSADDSLFQTANEISAMGHILMMSACQKHLNGAISKCVSLHSLISTSKGLIPLGEISNNREKDSFAPVKEMSVLTQNGIKPIKSFYYNGYVDGKTVTTQHGYSITGSCNHRVACLTASHELEWKQLGDLTKDDIIAIQLESSIVDAAKQRRVHSVLNQERFSSTKRNIKKIVLPESISKDLAFWLGCVQAYGHVNKNGVGLTQAYKNAKVLDRWCSITEKLFGQRPTITLDPRTVSDEEDKDVVLQGQLNSRILVEWMSYIGFSKSRISPLVLRSGKLIKKAFLEGCTLDGFIAADQGPVCLKTDKDLIVIKQLQIIAAEVGIPTYWNKSLNTERQQNYYNLFVEKDGEGTLRNFRFPEEHKEKKLADRVSSLPTATYDSYAFCQERLPVSREFAQIAASLTKRFYRAPALYNIFQWISTEAKKGSCTLGAINKVYSVLDKFPKVFESKIVFSRVRQICNIKVETADIEVEDEHNYIANGFVSHNTVNLPADATVEDIEEIYMTAWKEGLKSIAVYRDGSKELQPLTAEKPVEEPEEETWTAYRRKLTRPTPSITQSFDIGGLEGYFTIGMYEDGSPGELFIRTKKMGSTMEGILDAFATAVSLALQYGVPIETFISKYSGSKFEPAGITGDEDIPMVTSVMDYIFRWIRLTFVDEEDDDLDDAPVTPKRFTFDGPPCPICGSVTHRSGTCYLCPNCGGTTGCS
jgi:adenosylcobalamin-dependent ribonucleoside-diphosphate reductase